MLSPYEQATITFLFKTLYIRYRDIYYSSVKLSAHITNVQCHYYCQAFQLVKLVSRLSYFESHLAEVFKCFQAPAAYYINSSVRLPVIQRPML